MVLTCRFTSVSAVHAHDRNEHLCHVRTISITVRLLHSLARCSQQETLLEWFSLIILVFEKYLVKATK